MRFGRKWKVTRRRVAPPTVRRVDASWQETREFWERLRWARLHYAHTQGDVIFRPTDAARSLGEKPGTYRTWEEPRENDGRVPVLATIQKIARKFGVSWVWLMSGQGSPYYDHVMEEQFNAFARRLPEIPEDRRDDALNAMRAVLESYARKAS